ncbi:MAG: hypothetical protein SPM02_03115 [Bacteroidales bacterium]|nr:hypothetical protein [Bacteroidales bacterium]
MNIPLYEFDEMPRNLRKYLSNNGWHFNKAANDFAVSLMLKRDPETGKKVPIKPYTKEQVDELLKSNSVTLEHGDTYDYVYVANMILADSYGPGKSIEDELHFCRAIKDMVDDVDAEPDSIMICWYAKMKAAGTPIMWDWLL